MTIKPCDRRTFLRAATATLAAAGSAGCVSTGSSTAPTVEMTDALAFEPETLTVEVGATVEWTNPSGVDHTVTAYEGGIPDDATYFASGGFESERAARTHLSEGLVAPGGEYAHTFEQPGTYRYYCIPHESSGMVGTVRVE